MIARLLYNRPLKVRILILCLFIAALSSGLVALFSYFRASEIVRNNAEAQADRTVAQAASYFDARMRNIQGQVYSLVASSTFKQVVERNGEFNRAEEVAAMSNLQAVLSGPRIRDANIMSVYLYTPGSHYYELIFQPKGDFTETRIYQEMQDSPTQSRWLSPREDEVFQSKRQVVPFVVPLDFSAGTTRPFSRLSYLVVNVNKGRLQE